MAPGFFPFWEGEERFDFVDGNPAELGDFFDLARSGLSGVGKVGEKEDDFLVNVERFNVIRKTMASARVESNIEAGFFFDFAEGGFGLGFARLDVAFRKAPETVILEN